MGMVCEAFCLRCPFWESSSSKICRILDGDSSIGLDKKLTGLTDLQKKMLQFFHMGLNDKEIVKEMDGGSTSTIRNHRFTLREKMKQAKVFLALMELSEEKTTNQSKVLPIHRTATMVDQRYNITEEEIE